MKVYEERVSTACLLICHLIPMGEDYTVTICGGTRPHVGSAVMAQSRPSLTGQGVSVTSSVLNRIGHKDETIARLFAEKIAVKQNCTVVCTCGIHLDSVTQEQLDSIQETCRTLLDRILEETD